VCEATERSPGCTVDLGLDPRVHLLELIRTDAAGHVTERVSRWINRPGIEPEVVASGTCDEKRHQCEFVVTWAHPQKLDPRSVTLQLDGVERWRGSGHQGTIALAKGARPQVVVCDAEFPDGTRATYTRTLYAFYPEEAQASLLAVPVVPQDAAIKSSLLLETLRGSGWPARTIDEAIEPEVTFVMTPGALDAIPGAATLRSRRPSLIETAEPPAGVAALNDVRVVFPDETLTALETKAGRLGTLRPSRRSRFSRFADAVAAAGYSLGARPRRRAVVLVLSASDQLDISSFTAAQARAYLSEVMVPLVIWRVGDVAGSEWPAGPRLETKADVLNALRAVRERVVLQRIVWIEGFRDLRHLGRWLAPGLALAGRETIELPSREFASAAEAAPASIGPEGGPVHALAASRDGSRIFAGTHTGVFRSTDGGGRWTSASNGLPSSAVRSLVVASSDGSVVLAATESGLFRSPDAGARWKSVGGLARIASLAVDPDNRRVVFAGTEGGGVRRSDDQGITWVATAAGDGDFRALLVLPLSHAVLAASEAGMFRSGDRGLTWDRLPEPPARILALAMDEGGRILAATAGGGLQASTDAGTSWVSVALARSYLTCVAATGSAPSRLVAGSPDGIYLSIDGGKSWKLARLGPTEAVSCVSPASILAGTTRGAVRREGSAGTWKPSNVGLTGAVVYTVAATPDRRGDVLAGTSAGLLRGDEGSWTSVSGIPEGLVVYTVAPRSEGGDVLVGAVGSVGRSDDHGISWSFTPSYDAFSVLVDALHPERAFVATRGGLLRTDDDGRTWSASVAGFEKTFAVQLGADRVDVPVYYAATAGSGVFRSLDGGRSWTAGGSELTRRLVRSVAVLPGGEHAVYAGTDSGVFCSLDRGATWAPWSGGLPRAPVYALAFDPRAPGVLFAGTALGLFRSADAGENWSAFPPSAPLPAPVTALWLDANGGRLVVGTLGAGVFRLALPAPEPPR
jgi:photosystem II stability/assembly factor-like uncharacterized protein